MSRHRHDSADTPGQDSFLDILANITGILIILVMVMGVRAGRAPADAVATASPADHEGLRNALAAEKSLRDDVLEMAAEATRLEQAALAKKNYRLALAATKIEMEQELATQRTQLDSDRQAALDLQAKLSEAEGSLEESRRRLAAAENTQPETIVIESYPTPISRAVHGDEVHFQLRDGGVARVPMKELVNLLEREARGKMNQLLDSSVVTDTAGPIDGFRVRYTLRRRDVGHDTGYGVAKVGSVVELALAEFIPTANCSAEPLEAALRPNSEFRRLLADARPGRTTVTLWTYPSEFGAFRRLRKELYHLGFTVAARPLPEGAAISGSPDGTRSAAQ
ncbi:MAG: hypothetical protein U1E05_24300 [Patescibacteria group bacterium]|nr:hypothetical protein [Patescibacteria group bacterium]